MKVMTYNIRIGLGIDGRRSLSRIIDTIRESEAEIVCLQEVDSRAPRSGHVDQPKRLSERLGMDFAFQPNVVRGVWGYGNLILSKRPIKNAATYALTSSDEQRGLMEVTVNAPNGRLSVFCTHWGLSPEERLSQASECAAFVQNAMSPAVFCGDLNDSDDSEPITQLLSQSGLRDLVKECAEPFLTFPSDAPSRRIDYILGAGDIRATYAGSLETKASDHLPVVVDIEPTI